MQKSNALPVALGSLVVLGGIALAASMSSTSGGDLQGRFTTQDAQKAGLIKLAEIDTNSFALGGMDEIEDAINRGANLRIMARATSPESEGTIIAFDCEALTFDVLNEGGKWLFCWAGVTSDRIELLSNHAFTLNLSSAGVVRADLKKYIYTETNPYVDELTTYDEFLVFGKI